MTESIPRACARLCVTVAIIVCLSVTASTALDAQAGTGGLSGIVETQGGSPVGGAIVTYGRLAPTRGKTTPSILSPAMNTTTDPKGRFAIQNLDTGTYLLCVEATGTAYLNPCHWSASPPMYEVTSGVAISGAVIKVTIGSLLPIAVNDPQQLIAAQAVGKAAPPLIGAIGLSGVFIPAKLAASTNAGKSYTVTLPFDAPIGIFVSGGGFQLTDASSKAVPNGGQIVQVTIPSTGSAPNLGFTIVGASPPH